MPRRTTDLLMTVFAIYKLEQPTKIMFDSLSCSVHPKIYE